MSRDSIEERLMRAETNIELMQMAHSDVAKRLYGIERTVWIGVGIIAVVQVVVGYFIKSGLAN